MNYSWFKKAACVCLISTNTLLVTAKPGDKVAANVDKMEWWNKARFGMFIHWGVYSVPAGIYDGKNVDGLGEWIMQDAHIPRERYAEYARQFNPDKYNPEAWVKMAKDAGMKYIVITSKHHDGFALFNTKHSDWGIGNASPYRKDLLKPLAEACRRAGIKLGFYYSQANDWYNPGGAAAFGHWDKTQEGSMDEYIDKVALPQVKEILTNYGDIAELWWDVPTDMNNERAKKLHDEVVKLQPNIITNDRLGGDYKGDITTPEQYIPATGIAGKAWETCMTMNNSWGFKSTDNDWKSPASLIRNLIEIASKGGNYLLNVGPEPSGEFPAPIVERLKAIGDWMKVNGEAIYGTTASPFKKLPWGRSTQKIEGNHHYLYLHVFNWPKNGVLTVPGLQTDIVSAKILANGKALSFTKNEAGYSINVPAKALDAAATVIKIDLKGSASVVDIPVLQNADGSILFEAGMADVQNDGKDASISIEGADELNIGYWTDANDWISWQVDIKASGSYNIVVDAGTSAQKSEFTVGLDDTLLKSFITNTGDYNIYKEFSLGIVNVSKPGIYTFSIKPIKEGWNPINIRKINFLNNKP